jgi:hypothetical protein
MDEMETRSAQEKHFSLKTIHNKALVGKLLFAHRRRRRRGIIRGAEVEGNRKENSMNIRERHVHKATY